jgi:hypothetical protein
MSPYAQACAELASVGRLLARSARQMDDAIRAELNGLCDQLQTRADEEAAQETYRKREAEIARQHDAGRAG